MDTKLDMVVRFRDDLKEQMQRNKDQADKRLEGKAALDYATKAQYMGAAAIYAAATDMVGGMVSRHGEDEPDFVLTSVTRPAGIRTMLDSAWAEIMKRLVTKKELFTEPGPVPAMFMHGMWEADQHICEMAEMFFGKECIGYGNGGDLRKHTGEYAEAMGPVVSEDGEPLPDIEQVVEESIRTGELPDFIPEDERERVQAILDLIRSTNKVIDE